MDAILRPLSLKNQSYFMSGDLYSILPILSSSALCVCLSMTQICLQLGNVKIIFLKRLFLCLLDVFG